MKILGIYAVVYSHRFGTDVWLARNFEAARLSMARQMLTWARDELAAYKPEVAKEIYQRLAAGDFAKVQELYEENVDSEMFHIDGPLTVKDPEETEEDLQREAREVLEQMSEPEGEAPQ